MSRLWMIAALAAPVLSCGGGGQANPDASQDADLDAFVPFVEAPHGTAPQVVKVSGDVLVSPKVVPVFFVNDGSMQASIEDFLGQLAGSAYWSSVTSEYGVTGLAVRPTIVTTDAPPTTQSELETWLANHFDGQSGWPAAPDPTTVYAVYLPAGVTLQTVDGNSCQAFGGFHNETADPSQRPIIYALLARCSGTSLVDVLTAITSHELIEATTDPHYRTSPAYLDVDADHYVWSYEPGGEVADMCEYLDNARQRLVGNYVVQRTWSNASAAAGLDPCVPATSHVGAAPQLVEDLPIATRFSGTIMTKGTQISVGATKEVDVVLFSDVPTDNFIVTAFDAKVVTGSPPDLAFTWDNQLGKNGDTLHLQITRNRAGSSEFVVAVISSNRKVAEWWGYASN